MSTPKNDCGFGDFSIYPQPQHHIPMLRQQYHPHQGSMVDTHHPHTTVEVPILAMATTVTTLNHHPLVRSVELVGVLIQSTGNQVWVTLTTAALSAETSICYPSRKFSFILTWRRWLIGFIHQLYPIPLMSPNMRLLVECALNCNFLVCQHACMYIFSINSTLAPVQNLHALERQL